MATSSNSKRVFSFASALASVLTISGTASHAQSQQSKANDNGQSGSGLPDVAFICDAPVPTTTGYDTRLINSTPIRVAGQHFKGEWNAKATGVSFSYAVSTQNDNQLVVDITGKANFLNNSEDGGLLLFKGEDPFIIVDPLNDYNINFNIHTVRSAKYRVGNGGSIETFINGWLTALPEKSLNSYENSYLHDFNYQMEGAATYDAGNTEGAYKLIYPAPLGYQTTSNGAKLTGMISVQKLVDAILANNPPAMPSGFKQSLLNMRTLDKHAGILYIAGHAQNSTFNENYNSHIVISVKPVPPALYAYYDFAKYVDAHGGQVGFSFRDAYDQRYKSAKNGANGFFFESQTAVGHGYLVINSLGHSKLTSATATRILDNNIGTVFPGGAEDEKGKPTVIVKGHLYRLHMPYVTTVTGGVAKAEVECTEASGYHFTFLTTPNHPLQGTAMHGIFKDSSGELWMFQEGRGVSGEDIVSSNSAPVAARSMWKAMAKNLEKLLGGN